MNRKVWLWYIFAGGIAVGASLLGLLASSVMVSPETVFAILAKHVLRWTWQADIPISLDLIIWNIRAPRVVLGLLIGASLSLAGAAFQGLLRNPLADPYIIGVSSGASLGAVIVLFFQFSLWGLGAFTLPITAIIGGFVALVLVFGMTHLSSRSLAVETIILSGVIMTSFMSAIVSLIIALSQREDMSQILYWLMGNVGMRGWSYVQLLLPFALVGALLLLIHVRELNALALGESSAEHLGVNVRRKKALILIGASLLTGASVAVSGAIGFVGLVIPHLVRLVTGPDHRHVLPLSMLIGGAYLVLADLLARTVISPRELPIGVITALIGAPVFAFLLIRQQAGRRGRG